MVTRPSNPIHKYKYVVSACLAGINCTYKKGNNINACIKKLVDDERAITVCPEVMGGLSSPRQPCEIIGGDGYDVLDKKTSVKQKTGKDVTQNLIIGSKKTLKIAKKHNIRHAIFKSRSPSCGKGCIYDGTFTESTIRGDGVATAYLRRNGIAIKTEEEYRCQAKSILSKQKKKIQ